MKLIDLLKSKGVMVPDKKELPINRRNRGKIKGFNEGHDQWANIEVPEGSLNKDKVKQIIYKYFGVPSEHSKKPSIKELEDILNGPDLPVTILPDGSIVASQKVEDCVNEICSIQPTVKQTEGERVLEANQLINEGVERLAKRKMVSVPSEEEIKEIMKSHSGDDLSEWKLNAMSEAIRSFMVKGEKS